MSIHARNEQSEQALAAQRRTATLTSIIVSLLAMVLLGLLLAFIFFETRLEKTPEIYTYASTVSDDEVIVKPEIQNQVERKPSAPSSSMAKVIAANTVSPIAIPVVDTDVDTPTLDFGNGDDFGSGWGSGSGVGGRGGGGGATFFEQKVNAERICFVIDYSASMGGKRINLLKQELTRSIGALPESVQYQMVFFAGPAWVAGDKVTMAGNKRSAAVVHGEREYKWESSGGAHNWEAKGKRVSPQWMKATKSNIASSLEAITSTQLVWGTAWEEPLDIALDMKERPDVIFFMTDGASGSNSIDIAKKIARRARGRDIIINSIALMEPSVGDAMKELAAGTGGAFTMVDGNGKTKTILEAKEKK